MAVLSKAIHGLWEASLSMSQAETVPLFFGTLQVDKAFYFWEQGGQELPVMGTSQLPVPMHMTETLAQEGTLFLLGFSVLGTFQLLSGSADILWFDNYTSRSLQDPHVLPFTICHTPTLAQVREDPVPTQILTDSLSTLSYPSVSPPAQCREAAVTAAAVHYVWCCCYFRRDILKMPHLNFSTADNEEMGYRNESLLGPSATGMGKELHRASENVPILFPQHGKAHIILDRSLLAQGRGQWTD